MERLSDKAIDIINELHTDRLDYTSEYLPLIDASDRLAAYEDTGLEPEEINTLQSYKLLDKHERGKLFEYQNLGCTIERLRELAQADKDGRLVVLPCKDDVELKRNGQTFRADHWNHSLTAFRDAPETKSGKQVALFSIEEAEAALAQKGGTHEANPV